MDIDLDSLEINEDEQSAKLEAQLLADEQPVSREGDDDCGGACTI